MRAKQEAYLNIHPETPPPPASPPLGAPEALRVGAERALLLDRIDGEFAIGTCSACKETRLGATNRRKKDGLTLSIRCQKSDHGVFTGRNNAIPT